MRNAAPVVKPLIAGLERKLMKKPRSSIHSSRCTQPATKHIIIAALSRCEPSAYLSRPPASISDVSDPVPIEIAGLVVKN